MGLKEPTFWTLLTVREKLVVALGREKRMLGGTTVQPLQLAEDRPSSVGKAAVSCPAGIPAGATKFNVTDTTALLL